MSSWTKIAAILSIFASAITIYNVAVRPKDAPPIWTSMMMAAGLGPKPVPETQICMRVRRPVWPESTWAVRAAPGNDHKELGRISPGETVVLVSQTGDWVQIREQTGLGAQIQGWAVARAVDKIACPAPKKT